MKDEIIAKLVDLIVSANDLRWKFKSGNLEKEIEESILEQLEEMDSELEGFSCLFIELD